MNRSSQQPISDELLSAYIDGIVTTEEKAAVEVAVAADPALAWALESLRQTVELVQALPAVALPRSFVLSEDQVADVLEERRARSAPPVAARAARQPVAPPRRNFWHDFLGFFNTGNLLLRNATALAALFFVIILVTSPGTNSLPPGSAVLLSGDTPPAQAEAMASSEEPALLQAQAEPAAAAEKAAPVPAETERAADTDELAAASSPAETAPAETAPAIIAQAASAPAEAAPLPLERGAASAAMRSGPESQDAPGARIQSPTGGGLESGSAAFQAMPTDMAPPPPSAGIDTGPAYFSAQADVSETNPGGAAEVAADEPAAEEPASIQPAATEVVGGEAVSEEPVALKSAPNKSTVNETSIAAAESVAPEEAPVGPAAQDFTAGGWSIWQIVQMSLAGLVILLGFLWLRSRQLSS